MPSDVLPRIECLHKTNKGMIQLHKSKYEYYYQFGCGISKMVGPKK
jgi:hypothetical protein